MSETRILKAAWHCKACGQRGCWRDTELCVTCDRLARLEAENRALRAALAPFRALAAAYPHEVDGWLVTHTEPGLTLGDVRRLVGEGR